MTKLSVPNGKDVLRDVSADGIQEYDNPMPPWWLMLFYATIAFSLIYLLYMHVAGGRSLQDELAGQRKELAAMTQAVQSIPGSGTQSQNSSGGMHPVMDHDAMLAEGKGLFTTNCSPCHGPEGQGTIGPNLTDEFWLHGGTYADILKVISDGVPDKGMIAWKSILGDQKVASLAAYVVSLKGSNPPNPKAPQGTKAP